MPFPRNEQEKSLLEEKKEVEERKQQQYWKTVARQCSSENLTKEQAQEEAHKRAVKLHQELEKDYYNK